MCGRHWLTMLALALFSAYCAADVVHGASSCTTEEFERVVNAMEVVMEKYENIQEAEAAACKGNQATDGTPADLKACNDSAKTTLTVDMFDAFINGPWEVKCKRLAKMALKDVKKPGEFENALTSSARQNFNLHGGLSEDSRAFAAGMLGTTFTSILTSSSGGNDMSGLRGLYQQKALAAATMKQMYTKNPAVRKGMLRIMQKTARRVMSSPQMMSAVCGTDKVVCMKKFTQVANIKFFTGLAKYNSVITVAMLTAEACKEIKDWYYGRQSGEMTIIKVSANVAKAAAAGVGFYGGVRAAKALGGGPVAQGIMGAFAGLGAGWAADKTISYALAKFFDRGRTDQLTFCYRLIEVSPFADSTEVNSGYHAQALKSHPDKCMAKDGATKPVCEEKWCELNACMELIKAEREPDKTAGNEEEFSVADDDHDYDADAKLDKLVDAADDAADVPDEL